MSLEKKLELLKQRVINSFVDVPYPQNVLAPHECDECYELRKTFKEQNWKIIDPKIIEENYDQMPLFSSEAFKYFLPAYLIYSLENFNDNLVCEFTIYALSPMNRGENEGFVYCSEKLKSFSESQINVVYDFLHLVKEYEKEVFDHVWGINLNRLKRIKKNID